MKKTLTFVIALLVLTMSLTPAMAATEADIQEAIDSGLVWLAGMQNVDGSWGNCVQIGKTGLAVKKFEHEAILTGYDSALDPAYQYSTHVQDGLDYLFKYAQVVSISNQPHGDPDTDGDGLGVRFQNSTYYTGIALMAIAESNRPTWVVDDPTSAVDGWTYYQVAEDAMNWLAYGQVDSLSDRGGWGYDANPWGGDASNSGYASMGLAIAEQPAPHGMGLAVPQFVKDELGDPGLWMDTIQNHTVGHRFHGGSGCYNKSTDVNILETGNWLFEAAWYGDNWSDQRVQWAKDYMVRAWDSTGAPMDHNAGWWSDYEGWHGNYQAMFTLTKGLEAFQIDEIGGFDWFDEVSDSIVNTQHIDGSWGPCYWDSWTCGDKVTSTCWALFALQKVTVVTVQPVEFDIKPQSCPNPLNVKGLRDAATGVDEHSLAKVNPVDIDDEDRASVLPVAILGTADFDVSLIDPSTVMLEGVPALRWDYEDVSTPMPDGAAECECNADGADGYTDLTLKFDKRSIIGALGEVQNGDVIPLFIHGELIDGMPIEGVDCVIIRAGRDEALLTNTDGELGFSLEGNYPNPFNPVTEISFSVPSASHVRLEVFNVSGQKVTTLVDRELCAGYHQVTWDASAVASGVYFYRMQAGAFTDVRKMVLVK